MGSPPGTRRYQNGLSGQSPNGRRHATSPTLTPWASSTCACAHTHTHMHSVHCARTRTESMLVVMDGVPHVASRACVNPCVDAWLMCCPLGVVGQSSWPRRGSSCWPRRGSSLYAPPCARVHTHTHTHAHARAQSQCWWLGDAGGGPRHLSVCLSDVLSAGAQVGAPSTRAAHTCTCTRTRTRTESMLVLMDGVPVVCVCVCVLPTWVCGQSSWPRCDEPHQHGLCVWAAAALYAPPCARGLGGMLLPACAQARWRQQACIGMQMGARVIYLCDVPCLLARRSGRQGDCCSQPSGCAKRSAVLHAPYVHVCWAVCCCLRSRRSPWPAWGAWDACHAMHGPSRFPRRPA
jgi:hypothetical protein